MWCLPRLPISKRGFSKFFVSLLFERVDQPVQETSFAFHLCSAVTALTASQSGIEQIAHGIAEHVEGVDDNRQAKPGPDCQPWGHLHVLTPFPTEQATPAGNARGQTKSEEAQGSLCHNHSPDVDGEDDDEGRDNIGQDMANEDLSCGGAHGLGCQKIVILFDSDHGASDHSGAADASSDPQDQYHLWQTPPRDGHDR